jgi:RNA polymerase sigma-70 factor, ECF subfamily
LLGRQRIIGRIGHSRKENVKTPASPERDSNACEFMRLLAEHERRLTAYVHVLIPLWQDAEDVLQETRGRLWGQFGSFEPGTDFGAWSRTIAYYEVLTYRTHCQRERVCFSNELLEKISKNIPPIADSRGDEHVPLLLECVKTLKVSNRDLLQRIFGKHQQIKDIARELELTPSAIRVAFHRIRRSLAKCMEERLRLEEK